MAFIRSRTSLNSERSPLILLPGAYMHAQDFIEHGFVSAAQKGFAADIIAVETGMEAYLDGSIVGRLHQVISPLRHKDVRVWLAGVSLGGLGALLYAQAHHHAHHAQVIRHGKIGILRAFIARPAIDALVVAPVGDAHSQVSDGASVFVSE